MNSWSTMRKAPPVPSVWKATAGGTSPWPDSLVVMGRSNARPARPSVVASVNGMANQHMPPRR